MFVCDRLRSLCTEKLPPDHIETAIKAVNTLNESMDAIDKADIVDEKKLTENVAHALTSLARLVESRKLSLRGVKRETDDSSNT